MISSKIVCALSLGVGALIGTHFERRHRSHIDGQRSNANVNDSRVSNTGTAGADGVCGCADGGVGNVDYRYNANANAHVNAIDNTSSNVNDHDIMSFAYAGSAIRTPDADFDDCNLPPTSSPRDMKWLDVWAFVMEQCSVPTISASVKPLLSNLPSLGPPAISHVPGNERVRGEITRHGFPSVPNIRVFDGFVLSYDRRNRSANWVLEHLTRDQVVRKDGVVRDKCEFVEDGSVHPLFRATNKDFHKTGYDRGHLAAAGNHRLSIKSMSQTFTLSNIAPQVGVGFNRHAWNELEKSVRKLTKLYSDVYVCTGPLFLPKREADGKLRVSYEVIGANHVAVPTHFFKVVVAQATDGRVDMLSYVMPNAAQPEAVPLERYLVPVESIERASGLIFFDKISRDRLCKVNGVPTR